MPGTLDHLIVRRIPLMRKTLVAGLAAVCFTLALHAAEPATAPVAAATNAASFPGVKSQWMGFDRYDFTFAGRPAIVVAPKQALPGKPWAWRRVFRSAPG